MGSVRINKFISANSSFSRRSADWLISQGRVKLNDLPARLGDQVNPRTDTVTIDDQPIRVHPQKLVYFLLHKPTHVLSTTRDDFKRTTVLDLVKTPYRLFLVGRLDYDSSGLIILTNDGQLALKLTHPRYHIPKKYLVTVVGKVTPSKIEQIKSGVVLDDGKTLPARVESYSYDHGRTTLTIILHEGRKRQIRRMSSALKLHVEKLQRVSIGPLELKDLPLGKYRPLTDQEIASLRRLTSADSPKP